MRPKFRHLTLPDRIEIQKRFPATKQAEIARALGVSKSAISRELKAHSLEGALLRCDCAKTGRFEGRAEDFCCSLL